MANIVYKYTWKHGISFTSNIQVEFLRPLLQGMIFVDLSNGRTYRVHSLYKAKEMDRLHKGMPEDVVHTFPAGSLSDEELAALRKKHHFQPNEQLGPGEQFALLDSI